MPSFELNFLPSYDVEPTDEQLLLQLVYGLCKQLDNPREEECPVFHSAVCIPNPHVRRLAKLLVQKLNLPIPVERVDDWVEWCRSNHCWIVNEEMSAKAKSLSELVRHEVKV